MNHFGALEEDVLRVINFNYEPDDIFPVAEIIRWCYNNLRPEEIYPLEELKEVVENHNNLK